VTTVVADASVLAKWFLPDEMLREQAMQLLSRYTLGELRLIVPDLFWPEFGNILWKAVRQGRCSQQSANTAVSSIRERDLPTISSRDLIADAFAIASKFNRTVYDGLYVALAMAFNTQLVTADERLANALAAYLPVKWLGSI
jgi:predicted nucleic acid-binding protein